MPFFVIKKGLVLLEWKYFPTPKILDPILIAKERNKMSALMLDLRTDFLLPCKLIA